MKSILRILFVSIMFLVLSNNNVNAETKVISDVPYINQVLDMNQDEFLGHNACGPTSAVMMVFFHHLQQGMSPAGYYVYEAYNGFTDKSGNSYNNVGNLGIGTGPYDWGSQDGFWGHYNEIKNGAFGYIIRQNGSNWETDASRLESYIRNHGLITNIFYGNDITRFNKIKQNINSGLPLLGHWSGHYFVIKGYDTGINNDKQKIIVNDPYGDKNNIWNGTTSGEGKVYDFPIVASATIDRVHTIYPVGIYDEYPGFHTDGTSQSFLDKFEELSPKIGWPNDNGGTAYVHELISSYNSSYKITVQDYLGDINSEHYGSDGKSILMLNPLNGSYKTNLVRGGFLGLLLSSSDIPHEWGTALTDEIIHNYADCPNSLSTDPIQPGDSVTVQKFQQVLYYGDIPQAGKRKTMVWKNGIEAQHFAVSEFEIDSPAGVQWYASVNSDLSRAKPWPNANTPAPTDKWFTKSVSGEDRYYFFYYVNGQPKNVIPVFLNEGNLQAIDPGGSGEEVISLNSPNSLSTSNITTNQIQINWNGNNDGVQVKYRVYRKDVSGSGSSIYIATTSNNNYLDTGLNSNHNYCYQITAVYSGSESNKSSEICGTTLTASVDLPTVDFSVQYTAIYINRSIAFIDQSVGDNITSWLWDFGDGSTSNIQSPHHTYTIPGRYDVSLTVTDNNGSNTLTKSNTMVILAGVLPSPWGYSEPGSASIDGYGSYDINTNTFIIDSTGAGFDKNNTQLTYINQPYSGNVEIKTRLISRTISDPNGCAGIIISDGASYFNQYVAISATQGKGLLFQYKIDGVTTILASDEDFSYPIYLKLTRSNNLFNATYSYDSKKWNNIGSINLVIKAETYIGMFATPANVSGISTAKFDQVSTASDYVVPSLVTGLRILSND